MNDSMIRLGWAGLILLLASCTPASAGAKPAPTFTQSRQVSSTVHPIFTPAPDQTQAYNTGDLVSETPAPTFLATASVTQTHVAPELSLCSPLEGIPIEELLQPDLLKNLFQPPRPGMDDGHHGIDFAYWSRGDRKTMLGLPVFSVLQGRVAGIVHHRQPYGYAVVIETPLEDLPPGWVELIQVPTPGPTVQPAPNLYCPPGTDFIQENPGRSLYLLYAHLNQLPLVTLNQPVECGQQIGEVGTTGKSVNPHLHLETRVGPAGVTFPEMAHYENGATELEMQTYCTWRVSGLFQMFDPAGLFRAQTLQP